MEHLSDSVVLNRSKTSQFWVSALYRVSVLVLVCVLVLPGSAAAWTVPPEEGRIPAHQSALPGCGGPPPEAVPADWVVAICDKFEDNANGWLEGTLEDEFVRGERKLLRGNLAWQVEGLQDAAVVDGMVDRTFADFYAAVDVDWMEPSIGKPQYALQFRRFDKDNLYSFTVDASVNQYMLETKYRGEWQTLIDWTAAPAIRSTGMNRLGVLAQGSTITLFANGQQLTQFNDSRVAEGLVTLAVYVGQGDRIYVSFDNFEVLVPSGEAVALPTSAAPQPPLECKIPTSAPAGWPVVLCDSFLENRNAWSVGPQDVQGGKATREINFEVYDWKIEAAQDLYDWVGYGAQTFSDFYVSTSASVDQGRPETSSELVFRAADRNNYYTFSASGSYFQVSARYQGGWQELQPWTLSDALQPGFNDLAVLARGPELTFYINDTEVAKLTSDLIPAGQVGVGVTVYQGDTAGIRFDDLLVLTPPELAAPTPEPSPSAPPPPPRRTTPLPPTPAPSPTPAPPPTQAVPPAEGLLYQNAEWGFSVIYPTEWVTVEESSDIYFALQCGPSQDALAVFQGNLTPDTVIAEPALGLLAGYASRLMDMPAPDATGVIPSRDALERFISYVGEEFNTPGAALTTVGEIGPARAANADGSMAEVAFPNNQGRMYLAGFTSAGDHVTFLMVMTPEADRTAARTLFDRALASLRLSTPSTITPPVELTPAVLPIETPVTGETPQAEICEPPPNAPAGWHLALCDTFDDNRYQWPEGAKQDDLASTDRSINYGTYGWMISAKDNISSWANLTESQQFSDLHLALDVPYVEGPEEDTLGPMFRWKDADNYYNFLISADSFSLGSEVAGKWTNLIPWTETAALVKGELNRLEVTAIGPRITLYINGQKVGEIQDDNLKSGQIGLVTHLNKGDELWVEFDNLQVLVPSAGGAVPTRGPQPLQVTPAARAVNPVVTQAVTPAQRWKCLVCGYVYDPAVGDPTQNIPAGTSFEDLPDNWTCPDCGAAKDLFEAVQ